MERLIARNTHYKDHVLYNFQEGSIEVIMGSVFSGKSEELTRQASREIIAKHNIQVFNYYLNRRHGSTHVRSHNGTILQATSVKCAKEILYRLNGMTTTVLIEGVQFFDSEIIPVCRELAAENIHTIVAGLDLDFRGEPFGPTPALAAEAESVHKLHAICIICGDEASRSQRLIDGEPANYNDSTIKEGAIETYEARCRHCHAVPGKFE